MILNNLATELEQEAIRLRELESKLRLPVQEVNIDEARAKLSAVLDGEEFDLVLLIRESKTYRGKETKTTVHWSVTVKYNSYKGVTLAEAVNSALKALEPEQEGDVDGEIAVVEEAFASPLPL